MLNLSKYYNHHCHTAEGSIGDSILKISEYVKKAKDYGLDKLTISDHGSLSAMYTFISACHKNDITPIIGMEAYEVEDVTLKDKEHRHANHLLLLAKNEIGLQNLFAIHNFAQIEGFYYKPKVDLNILKEYGNGIIACSACIAGRIPEAILNDDLDKAIELINGYKEVFDEFYLEIQPGKFEEQILVNDALIELGDYTNTPVVVTNDVHYLNPEDYIIHDYHVKLGRQKDKEDFNHDTLVYPDTCYWFMDKEHLIKNFTYTDILTREKLEEAIYNTSIIASECNIEFSDTIHMPEYKFVGNNTEEELLYKMCYEKLEKVIQDKPNPQDYIDRVERELKVIKDKKFCGYFLVVQDYINWSRKNNIAVGPGRGSCAGCLVAFLLGITRVDPIKYGLLFERFLDPNRDAIPDIDSDFNPQGREQVFKYTIDTYGYNNCAKVSTLHVRKAKGAVRDATRILGYEPSIGDTISKLIPTVVYGDDGEKTKDLSIQQTLEVVPEFKTIYEQYKDIIDLASRLEGLPSSAGLHAAGILISPIDFTKKLPLIKSNTEGVLATSLDLESAEHQFVKMDYLAIATMNVILKTEQDSGYYFDYANDDYDDDKVWNVIGSKNTTGLFQIASKTYKDRMPRLKPRSMKELAACIALVRGPAISAKTDELYMQIIEGTQEIKKIHPLYDEITKDTNGVLIFQEQIMKLAVNFGMDLSTGYKIVKLGASYLAHLLEIINTKWEKSVKFKFF